MDSNTFTNSLQQLDIVSECSYGPYLRGNYQSLQVKFKQPVDHNNPDAGSFLQKAYVFFVGSDRPTVFHTCGYGFFASPHSVVLDPAVSMNANAVIVEHRYYGDSKVNNDPRWDYLTIEQAAADHHAIFQALKPLLPKGWISTGLSKDGETAVFYRYLYPEDTDVTVAFCSPFMTSLHDPSVGHYLQNECGSPAEHDLVVALMRRMLEGGENGIYKKFKSAMEGRFPAVDTSFTHYVHFCFEYFFGVFQYRFNFLPPVNSPDEVLFRIIMNDALTGNYIENDPANWYPWFVQLAKQLGRYEHAYGDYADLLEGTSFDKEEMVKCLTPLKKEDQWLYGTYDNTIIKDIREQFLPNTDLPFLFVYSKNDPWSGTRIQNVNQQHSKIIINPNGVHGNDILNPLHYSPEIKQEILDFVGRFVSIE